MPEKRHSPHRYEIPQCGIVEMVAFMELYITELSKYFITLFIACYTLECFLVFRFQEEERRKAGYIRQNIWMFLVHFSCFLVICFETGKIEYLLFYVLQQILLFSTIMLFRMIYPKGNLLIMNNTCMHDIIYILPNHSVI